MQNLASHENYHSRFDSILTSAHRLHAYSQLPHPPLDPRTPDSVTPILSMSSKYQVDHIRNTIIERLESDWPQSLFEWDLLEKRIKSVRDMYDALKWRTPPEADSSNSEGEVFIIRHHFPEPCSAIRLAKQYDIPSILPSAFYRLACIYLNNDWHRPKTDEEQRRWRKEFLHRSDLLTVSDMATVIRGVEALKQHRTLQIPFEHTDHEAETCKAERFLEHMNTVRGNRIGTGKGLLKTDILGAFAYFSEDLAKTKVRGKIAASCTTKIQGEIRERKFGMRCPSISG